MILLALQILALTFTTSYSANILVIAGPRGSHLYVSLDVAEKLVEFGHNVTVLTPLEDTRIEKESRGFRFVAIMKESQVQSKRWYSLFQHFLHLPSPDMMSQFIVKQYTDETIIQLKSDHDVVIINFFRGEGFEELLKSGNFDLIVLENSVAARAMLTLADKDYPIMGLLCYPGARDMADKFDLPGLQNSVPSWMNDVTDSPPTFFERVQTLIRMARFYPPVISSLRSFVRENAGPEESINKYFKAIFDVCHDK